MSWKPCACAVTYVHSVQSMFRQTRTRLWWYFLAQQCIFDKKNNTRENAFLSAIAYRYFNGNNYNEPHRDRFTANHTTVRYYRSIDTLVFRRRPFFMSCIVHKVGNTLRFLGGIFKTVFQQNIRKISKYVYGFLFFVVYFYFLVTNHSSTLSVLPIA